MLSPTANTRPYRSHLRPACLACRRRKSRCKIETDSASCHLCNAHGTECIFPDQSEGANARASPPAGSKRQRTDTQHRGTSNASSHNFPSASDVTASSLNVQTIIPREAHLPSNANVPLELGNGSDTSPHHQPPTLATPLARDDVEEETPHIVGPANTQDSQVLADYLSVISHEHGGMRMIKLLPTSRSKPVLFARVQKRPLGALDDSNPSRRKLVVIEKLLEPYLDYLTDLYFEKVNTCLPLLDHGSFKSQYSNSKHKLSPALLANLYAHSMTYWRFHPVLGHYRPPDQRFIWNLANEAVYSELHLSPGISTVTAILLNVTGRPTTSLIGNGVLLGAAVSLAHSLGLNRNPLPWDIPEAEKFLRMKIWWTLFVIDKWSSLAHGTPPHIQRIQYDVVPPSMEHFPAQSLDLKIFGATSVFIAFFGLTEVLDHCLQHMYDTSRHQTIQIGHLELKLNQWVEGLDGDVRRVITRGTQLNLPGAANLRLAYLSTQLLLRRLELEKERENEMNPELLENRYVQVRRTAEEIVLLVQELQNDQLGGFWLPMSAFVFSSTATFLLRCALETEGNQLGLARNTSLRLAWDLITTLQSHRDKTGWDLGDICVTQYAEIVDKLMTRSAPGDLGLSFPDLQDLGMPDPSFLDELYPNPWDVVRDFG